MEKIINLRQQGNPDKLEIPHCNRAASVIKFSNLFSINITPSGL